ncbi:MAG: tRNA (guanosine(46)-N7)-methyltransferase TrmB [Actinomycetota bacterium]|nr:tRNA (guanosine(46)-N7)-methyltransferase TrmB [Actinomycetota bacterium]
MAYRRQVQQWTLPVAGEALQWAALFGALPVVLDIGFGGGEAVVALAAERPGEAIVGVDVHTPGIAHVLDAIEANFWQHVRVVDGDVLEFLPRVPLGSLAGVRLWFPDPWPKNKQRHRRLFRPDVVAALVDRVRVGGTVHVATDIEDYARQVADVAAADGRLHGGQVDRPEWRPLTRYERRGLAAGRTPHDMVYERVR